MTNEEYQARREMLDRARALVDDWIELKALGDDALRYC